MLQRFQMCLACAALVAVASSPAAQELPQPCINCVGGFVSSGAANYITSGNTGTINQLTERAILNWQSFNIGNDGAVVFNQPSVNSAALNRIFQDDPVRILGSLTANGQVYLINPNGIIFGNGAQVNARAFVASTLGVSDDVFLNLGITGAINVGDSTEAALPAFSGNSNSTVELLQGARIKVGERVVLVGAEVRNEGVIEAPNGQAILAGSHDVVYLAADPAVRGLLVEVGRGGEVTNLGSITTDRGNTTLVGLAVNQSGRISASTSVNVNGSVRLLARDGVRVETHDNGRRPVAARGGDLILGEDSITEVQLADLTETAVDGQPQQRSFVEGSARTIHVKSDARILVPGGDVTLTATSTPNQALTGGDRAARVFLDQNSLIDVSGDASALIAMERNQGTIKLFGNELADAPVQRDGPLARQPILVDLRRGTPLTDIGPLLEQVRRTVGERMSAGGTVSLRAEGDVVLDTEAVIDISGGQIEYLPGFITTTKLTANGRTIDISEADPLVQYDGIINTYTQKDSKWGVTRSWIVRGGQFEQGYVEGKDAGKVLIETRTGSVALAGRIRSDTVQGSWQHLPATNLAAGLARPFTQVPLGGTLEMSGLSSDVLFRSSLPPQVFAFDTILPQRLATTIASSLLEDSGINRLSITTAGRVDIPDDVSLVLDPGGSFAVSGSDVRVAGDISIQSGEVKIAATATTTQAASLEVGSTAEIDVAGGWINETVLANGGAAKREDLFVDGGRIELASQGDLLLEQGSRLNVSAGAALMHDEALRMGDAGSISLAAQLPSAVATNFDAPTLTLAGQLEGFGFSQGGRLEVAVAAIQIGGVHVPSDDPDAVAGLLHLAPEFFRSGGFADFDLSADQGDITIEAGTELLLRPDNLSLNAAMFRAQTGTPIETVSDRVLLPGHERGSSSLTATIRRAQGVSMADAEVRVGAGARVETELGGHIALSSDTNIRIDGALVARGGVISADIVIPDKANESGYVADQAIRVGSGALLDVSGGARIFEDAQGRRSGEVLDGGTIALRADRGSVFGAPDARLDVSGTSDTLNLASDATGLLESTVVASAAGAIEVRVAEGGSIASEIDAHGGGGTAAGGTLRVTIDANRRDPNFDVTKNPSMNQFPTSRREIVVANGPTIVGPDATLLPAQNGKYFLAAPAMSAAGFDTIELTAEPAATLVGGGASAVRIDALTLSADRRISIDAAIIESGGGLTTLAAPHIALGQTENTFRTQPTASTSGSGRLVVNANHIDLNGTLVLNGFGADEAPGVIFASTGDIRLNGVRVTGEPTLYTGSLTTTANVLLDAQRIFPSTLTDYAINVVGAGGRIEVQRSGEFSTPLSAAGKLTLAAANIEQGGVLSAPFGSIDLKATESLTLLPGSVTSVSGANATIPFGVTEFGKTWIYPFDDKNLVVDGAPERRVGLKAPEIDIQQGSLLDLQGGGELLTFEFVKGPGGSRDILLADNIAGAFAIVPATALNFGVLDPLESADAGIEVGSTIELAGGSGVPAGEYVRLPARYALLPGAYLVTPVEGSGQVSPAVPQFLADDRTPVVAGRLGFAGNDTRETRWSAYAIESAEQVRTRAEFNVLLASKYFTGDAARPADAGGLTIEAERAIQIDGALAAAAAAGGRGASVDVTATDLTVVKARTGNTQRVEVVDTELANFAAASLMLGGTRSRDEEAVDLNVRARSVRIEADTVLSAAEIILAASEDVTIDGGARIVATGASDAATPEEFRASGNGAFVRASTAAQAVLERVGASGQTGVLTIAEGATVSASGSINLEASRDVKSAGDLVATGGSLSLTASQISLGDTSGAPGLVLTNADLARFQARELQLNSRSTIDIVGATSTQLETVKLDAAGLRGFDNDGRTASLSAHTILLQNSRNATVASAGTGTGSLLLDATQLELGQGSVAVTGFSDVAMRATRQLAAVDAGALRVEGDLSIQAPRMTAAAGVDTEIVATGALLTRTLAAADQPGAAALGAQLRLSGASIDHGGRIELASGRVTLEARDADGLILRADSVIDTSGRSVQFDTQTVQSPGGDIALAATTGSIQIQDGATLDVSGHVGAGKAGRIEIDAVNGALSMGSGANLRGAGAEEAGTFIAEVARLDASFSTLNAQLNANGFTQRRNVSVGTGDLIVASSDSIVAQNLNLEAAGGSVIVEGLIDARSASGGDVRLSASGDVRVGPAGRIDAAAAASDRGGRVELATTAGTIDVATGAVIDVAGTRNGLRASTGSVHLRAPRIGTTSVAVNALPTSSFAGAQHVDIEAVRSYDATTLDSTLMNTIAADTDAYMAGAAAIEGALGVGGDDRFRLIAGEEVRSLGDLTLAGAIDLSQRRYDGTAGVLTLRAAGNLNLNGMLSDGLAAQEIVPGYPRGDVVQTGESWSYRLVGGARLDATDPLRTQRTGNVVVGDGAVVRTGTGSIDVSAGNDLVFNSGFGSIYTVGENRGTGALTPEEAEITLRGDFVDNGGDIRVNVGRDIRGVTDVFFADYLPRNHGDFAFWREGVKFPLAWAVDPSKFVQGIGALAGGNISIDAARDVTSLTLAVPTNAQPREFDGSALHLAGGGDVAVHAGGTIAGGSYLVGRGSAKLSAGETIGKNAAGLAPTLQIGDALVELSARGDVEIGTAFSPTVGEQDLVQGLTDFFFFREPTYASSYTNASGISARSIAGDVTLSTRSAEAIAGNRPTPIGLLRLYPGNLLAHSLSGDVLLDGQIDLFPAANGHLEVFAADSIKGISPNSVLFQSDADVRLLPSLLSPARTVPIDGTNRVRLLDGHASTPVHFGDDVPARIVAQTGDIGSEQSIRIVLAEEARIYAGRDILNPWISVQHPDERGTTVIRAGRDIVYPEIRGAAGFLVDASNYSIDVAGPGRLDLIAGRHIELGTSKGVVTRGNISNPALAEAGATITIMTGQSGSLPIEAFIEKYLGEDSEYLPDLAEFVAKFSVEGASDLAKFRALDAPAQRAFIVAVFFNELRESGVAATKDGDFSRGYAAIETLFPDEKYTGNLSSFLSRISTLDGGDINLLVPGGLVNAGVASSGRFTRSADMLGVVAQRDGDVNGFVKGDFLVNASRVFALDGGDVLLWSSDADIDAGRGAKSALAIPPPTVRFDAQGNTVVEFPPAVSGSGIRTAVSTPGKKPGDVYLFAPSGVVDAGDAGIESAGNITVAATQVIGADNITAGGTSVGVPVDTGGIGASLAGVSAASSGATNSATTSEDTEGRAAQEPSLAESALSWLEVFVVGLGEDNCRQDDMECLKRQKAD